MSKGEWDSQGVVLKKKARRQLSCKSQENYYISWLSQQEPASLKGTACKLRGTVCVGNGSVALKMPPSQGDSGCPANLMEFLSCRNQLSAREELRGAPVTGRLTMNQPWSCISCRGSHGSGMPPPAGLWAEPTYATELQGCRKSTVKIPLVCRSLFPIVSINSRDATVAIAIAWSSDFQRSLQLLLLLF